MSVLQIVFLILAVLALVLALVFGVFRVKRVPAAPAPVAIAEPEPRAATAPAAAATEQESSAELNARFEAIRHLQWLALGSDDSAPTSIDPADEDIASKVRWLLSTITDKPNYVPRRPLLLPKLVQAMNNDDVSRRELARIIASDPALTVSLLRLANSPFYRITSAPIESLDRAVALLGIEGMRSLVAAALMQPVFRITSSGFLNFSDIAWRHTLSSAAAAEAHAVMLESSDPFVAQLLSLIMGVATIVVFRVTLDEYQSHGLPPQPRILTTLIESQVAPVARQIASSWQLSERVNVALADQDAPHGAKISSLGRSVQFGRFLGALAVLHELNVIDDAAINSALNTAGSLASAYQRIWARRLTLQSETKI